MADIEYKGIKLGLGGNRLFIIIPAVFTVIGFLYGGFEAYNSWILMQKKIQNYTAPDLSGINKRITALDGKVVLLNTENESLAQVVREQINSMKETVAVLQADVYDIKLEIKQDISKMSDRIEAQLDKQADNLDAQEIRNRNNVGIVRDIINSFEVRIDQKVERLDQKIDTLEKDLDEKITIALSNPLNN
jgi:hypothetical protein